MQRAYSLIEFKEFDNERRKFSGTATSPIPDRIGDVINPKGVKFAPALPLLLYHDNTKPVGEARFGKATADGIPFGAVISEVDRPGVVKERLDEAIDSLNAKPPLIRGVSIGFVPLVPPTFNKETGGFYYDEIEVLELSMVVIPMHQDATIHTLKSFDTHVPAATGEGTSASRPSSSAVVDPLKAKARKGATTMKKTYPEQIKDVEATRAAKAARMEEIQSKAMEDGRAKDEQERVEFDELRETIKGLDAELVDLRDMEKMSVSKATPITPANTATAEDTSKTRGGHTITVSDKLDKGIGFARAVKANLVARLDSRNPIEVAKEMYPSDERLHKHLTFVQSIPAIVAYLKAAVPAATTVNSLWAGALTDPTNLAGEFVEFLRPATIIGRLNLRSIPTNVRLIEQTQGGTGYWVGQGAPKPLTAFGYAPITLSPTKVAAIAVATEESLRFSSPSLDGLIRDGLRDALVERVDRDLLDPLEAGSANVQPASLTNGLTPMTSAGTSSDNIRTDIGRLVRTLRTNNLRGPIVIVLPDSLLTAMAWMVNSLGQPEFPGLTGEGGSFNGVRFIGSEYVANSSGAGNMIVAIAEREVFQSDDGGVRVDASREASLQMLDNPTNNSATGAPTTMVSMWQTNSVAFRGEWFVNWQKRRATAVAFIDDANWGSVGSP